MSTATAPAPVPARPRTTLGRLERPALMGVLVREIINFSSFWKSSVFSSTVEPTIYLLAFGFGFGSLVTYRRRPRLRPVRRHRHGRHRGAVLVGVRGDVRLVREVPVPAHLRRDPRRAGRHRGARHRRGDLDRRARRRVRLRADAGGDRVRARPELGDAARPVHRRPHRLRLGVLRDHHRRGPELDRSLLVHHEHGHHAGLPRPPARSSRSPACPSGRRCSPSSTRCTTACSSCATPASASRAGSTSTTWVA